MRLFPDNASCHEFNKKKLIEINKPITKLQAVNRPTRARNFSEDNFYGLNNLHFICIDAKITLTNNLWTSKGLVNGANGTIKDILYKPNENLPFAILIDFDDYIGPKFFPENDTKRNWIPPPRTRLNSVYSQYKALPLYLILMLN